LDSVCYSCFSYHGPPPTQIYTLSLHDALPISKSGEPLRSPPLRRNARIPHRRHAAAAAAGCVLPACRSDRCCSFTAPGRRPHDRDRKSTRLNSSHVAISYAVFCLKKKKTELTACPMRPYPISSESTCLLSLL